MAGSRGDIEAGRAFVTLFMKNELLTRGLKAAHESLRTFARQTNQLGGAMQRLGLTVAAPFLATLRHSEKVRTKLDEIAKTLSGALEPAVIPMVDAAAKLVERFAAWAKENPTILQTVLKIGVGLLAAGVAVKAIAASATVLSVVAGAAAAIVGTVGAPLLIAAAAIAGAVALWARFSESGQRATRAVAGFLRDVGANFNSLVGLIASGQMEAAWELVIARMQITWRKFQDAIRQGWLAILPAGAKGGFLEAFRDALKGEVAEGARELQILQDRLNVLMEAGAKWGIGGGIGAVTAESAAKLFSSASAGGAVALTAGGSGSFGKSHRENRIEALTKQMEMHLKHIGKSNEQIAKGVDEFKRGIPARFGR